MSKDGEKALRAIVKARTILLVSNPFFGCLSLHLIPVETTSVPTMGVDGKHLFYNPEFVNSLTDPELTGVCAHEVMHCCYRHMTRRQGRDHQRYNLAGDFVINMDLKAAGFTLPHKPATMKDLLAGKKGHCYDPAYAGMSTEEVYERLPEIPPQQGGGGGGGGGGGDMGGCGAVMDAGSKSEDGKSDKAGGSSGATKEAMGQEWEILTRQAVMIAKAQNAGKVPGHLERLVGMLSKPKVNWKDMTRDFIDGAMNKDYSWSRPNRRFLSEGLILPGSFPDSMHHLVGVVDVSGSVDDKMMRAFVSEIAGALDDGIADKLTIIYADTDVRQVDEFLPGDVVTAKTAGGGGTDFANSFKWISQNANDASCIIYLTDMETCSFGEDPGCPVMWACWSTSPRFEQLRTLPSFGQSILVDSVS